MHKICTAIVASTVFISPAFANDNERGDYGRDFYRDSGGQNFHPAPAPIVGASLPVLAVGYGVYWLVRRRRNANGRRGSDALRPKNQPRQPTTN